MVALVGCPWGTGGHCWSHRGGHDRTVVQEPVDDRDEGLRLGYRSIVSVVGHQFEAHAGLLGERGPVLVGKGVLAVPPTSTGPWIA